MSYSPITIKLRVVSFKNKFRYKLTTFYGVFKIKLEPTDDQRNKSVLIRLVKEVSRLNEEIRTLRKEVHQMNSSLSTKETLENILPLQPFSVKDEFIEFDKSLFEDETRIQILKSDFARSGGEDSRQFIKQNLRKLLVDDVAQQFSWSGTSNKISIKSFNTIVALKSACMSTIVNSTEASVEKQIKRHFQYAKERITHSVSLKKLK